MTEQYWTPVQPADEITFYSKKPEVKFIKREGIPQGLLAIKAGAVRLKGIAFDNGTIEFDMKPLNEGDAAIMFRRADHNSGEVLYVRPSEDCAISQDCLQYAPVINGNMLWDFYPQYQRPASINPVGWNHFRIVVSGLRMNVYVNGSVDPTLSVGHLESSAHRGQIELISPATFANLRVFPGVVGHLPPSALPDLIGSDPRYVRNWKVSAYTVLATKKDVQFADRPSTMPWKRITTERNGAINLTRVYKTPDPGQLRCVSWLTTDIVSDNAQEKNIAIGWLREVWVFVNGRLIFSGRNFWDPPGPKLPPDGRLSLENGTLQLPLRKGLNQIDIAISNEDSDSNTHFGWGLQLRLENLRGVRLSGTPTAETASVRHQPLESKNP